jgi:excisionase family DNA binding protein
MSKTETALSDTAPLSPERLAFSIQEVAEALGVSRDIVNDLVHSKQLRSLHVGRRHLISRQAIEDFIAAGEAA